MPRPQFPHGDYVGFCEDLAKQIGAQPDLEKIKIEDPDLYQKLWTGPLTPEHYRLTGFGSNPESAQRAIQKIFSSI